MTEDDIPEYCKRCHYFRLIATEDSPLKPSVLVCYNSNIRDSVTNYHRNFFSVPLTIRIIAVCKINGYRHIPFNIQPTKKTHIWRPIPSPPYETSNYRLELFRSEPYDKW